MKVFKEKFKERGLRWECAQEVRGSCPRGVKNALKDKWAGYRGRALGIHSAVLR